MNTQCFYLMPTQDLPLSEGFERLSRREKMRHMRHSVADLDASLTKRFDGWDLEYLEGVGGWMVRCSQPTSHDDVERRVRGLPVEVAENGIFTALSGDPSDVSGQKS